MSQLINNKLQVCKCKKNNNKISLKLKELSNIVYRLVGQVP